MDITASSFGDSTFIQEKIKNCYSKDFKNLLRITETQFAYLFERVEPLIRKRNTNMYQSIFKYQNKYRSNPELI